MSARSGHGGFTKKLEVVQQKPAHRLGSDDGLRRACVYKLFNSLFMGSEHFDIAAKFPELSACYQPLDNRSLLVWNQEFGNLCNFL
jgi:hypothetical protein